MQIGLIRMVLGQTKEARKFYICQLSVIIKSMGYHALSTMLETKGRRRSNEVDGISKNIRPSTADKH